MTDRASSYGHPRSFVAFTAGASLLLFLCASCDGGGQSSTGNTGGDGGAGAGMTGTGAGTTGTGAGTSAGGAGGSTTCTPTTCEEAGAACGSVADGCGQMLDCGGCLAGLSCESNACVVPGCSGEWTVSKTDQPNYPWNYNGAIEVDGDGRVVVVAPGYVAEKPAGGAWKTTQAPIGGWNVDVVLDPNGAVHVSGYVESTGELTVSTREPGSATFTTSVVENIGTSHYQASTSLFVDSQGNLHARYRGNGELHHALRKKGETTWEISVAAPIEYVTGSTSYASNTLAVDAAGGIHIVYFSSSSQVSYAYKAPGAAWIQTPIETGANLPSPPSLVLDKDSGVHLLYLAGVARKLRHAYKPAGGDWTLRTLVDGINQIFDPDFRVDSSLMLHATYRRDEQLVYFQAPLTGTELSFYNLLKSGVKQGEEAVLAVDEGGGVHIAMATSDKIEVAYRCPGPCPAKTCTDMGKNCGFAYNGCGMLECGMCADPMHCGAGGEPNVCCVLQTCDTLGATCGGASDGCGSILDCGSCPIGGICHDLVANQCGCTPGKWGPTVASGVAQPAYRSGLSFDAQNSPHIVYGSDNTKSLIHTTKSGTSWQSETIDPLSNALSMPYDAKIATDTQGGLHVAYSVSLSTGRFIRYATRAAGSAQWMTSDLVAQGGNHIVTSPIAVDPSNNVHVVYYDDVPTGMIMHAERPASGGIWVKTPIAPGGNNLSTWGELTSVATDAQGGVHATYSITTGGVGWSIAYAYRAPMGSFVTEVIETGGTVQPWNAVAVDGQGGVHVSYAHTNGVYYAHKPSGGAFTTMLVASAIYVETDIVADALGTVHIAYYDDKAGVRDIFYAKKPIGGAFAIGAIETQGDLGRANQIGIDPTGMIHVVYRDSTIKTMRHAFRCPD